MRRRLGLSLLALAPAIWASAQNLVPADLVLDTRFVTGVNGAVGAEFLPDGRMVIIRQGGQLRVRPAGGGNLINAGSIAVDVSSERGLLGVAVDPDFATSNRIYFYFSASGSPANDRHRVAWATIDPATNIIDTANMTTIVRGLYGPANHNGGGLAFGPDRNLYIGVGDTGCNCNCAPGQADNYFATCLTNANGKILRVDRDGNIPPTNPLVGVAAVPACGADPRPENSQTNGCNAPLYQTQTGAPRLDIYNWGFRNPWRFTFDPINGQLWIGDVGEVTWEEITISTGPGQHHGWPFREGQHGDATSSCQTATPQATGTTCVEPVFEYPHGNGAGSISGGKFTVDCSWPAPYQGRYWFSDYTADISKVFSIMPNATRDGVVANSSTDIITNAEGIVHFANGPDGALYLVNANDGAIWRLAPRTPVVCAADAGVSSPDAAPVANPDAAPGPNADAAPAANADAAPAANPDATPVAPNDDAGPTDDAAPVNPDAAPVANRDAAAAVNADAGPTFADAVTGEPEPAGSGCSCGTTSESTALFGALFVLGLVSLGRRNKR